MCFQAQLSHLESVLKQICIVQNNVMKQANNFVFDFFLQNHSKQLSVHMLKITVGAQSIARAQSIAHSHIGDVIYQKTKIYKHFFLKLY